ncbi:TPA: hypothetical protein I9Z66_003015 [Clostridium perfringens]|nr:hypothetical protein [Clostridium perfringens]
MDYHITLEDDKTIKQLVERFYIIPRKPLEYEFKKEEREFLEKKAIYPVAKEVKEGKNGYIVFRRNVKKITDEKEIEEIKKDTRPQRKIAQDHGVSVATINKIKKNKY